MKYLALVLVFTSCFPQDAFAICKGKHERREGCTRNYEPPNNGGPDVPPIGSGRR